MASAPITIMSDGASMLRLSGARCPEGIRHSLFTSTRLSFATEQAKLRSACDGLASQRMHPKQAQCLQQWRSSSKGWTTTVLDPKCLKMERGPAVHVTSGFEDTELPLKRNEIVDLLSMAVQTLLKPENQQRLRKQLEKNKQQMLHTQSKGLERPSVLEQWKFPAPTISLQDLEEELHSAMQSDSGDSARCPSEQSPMMIDIPKTSQMTDLLEPEGQFGSMATTESSAGSVESEGDNSLTSLRRLKVLDVHSYVHNALRAGALRSWLHSRTIEGI